MQPSIEHEARVLALCGAGKVRVAMYSEASDACRGCAMASGCRSGKQSSSSDAIEVDAIAGDFGSMLEPGVKVRVSPASGSTARAASLLLVFPLAGLLAGALIPEIAGEGGAASAAGACIGTAAGFIPALISATRGKAAVWRVTSVLIE